MPVPAPLISTPDDATPAWLTTALVASGAAPADARVAAVTATTIGNGKVGQNVRFALTWADDPDGLPATVVGKFASDDPTSRMAGLLTGTYVREAGFYRELGDGVAMSIPRCHVAEIDLATGEFVLLFDDVAPADTGDQIAGCTVDQAALAMEELARLHAGFWGRPPTAGDWLVARNHDGGAALATLYEGLVGAFLARFGPRLSPVAADVVERLTPRVGAWIGTDEGQPLTLLHGDYRLENMLFGLGPDVAPLTVVDWQTPNLGAGPSDAAYFCGGALDPEVRRTHERELLEVYRQGLAAAGVELSAEDCWASYRRNTLAGVHMTVVASVLVGQDDRGDEMFLAMIERGAAHVADLDTLSLLGA